MNVRHPKKTKSVSDNIYIAVNYKKYFFSHFVFFSYRYCKWWARASASCLKSSLRARLCFISLTCRSVALDTAWRFFFFPECVERVKLSFAQYLPSASLADDAGCHQLSQNQTGGSKRTICTWRDNSDHDKFPENLDQTIITTLVFKLVLILVLPFFFIHLDHFLLRR